MTGIHMIDKAMIISILVFWPVSSLVIPEIPACRVRKNIRLINPNN